MANQRTCSRPGALEELTTEQVPVLYERAFSPLDRKAKQRIVQAARNGGSDRGWEGANQIAA